MNRPTWDEYFMGEAAYILSRSPDKNTKHGAVIVDDEHLLMGQGYNGFPRGGFEDYPMTRPKKYPFVIHAERNAILNSPHRPKNCTLYVTGKPCSGCMKDIVQSGIKKIIFGKVPSAMVDEEDWVLSKWIAKNHGIELVEYEGQSPIVVFMELIDYLQEKGWD